MNDFFDTTKVGHLLGCSARHARRLARTLHWSTIQSPGNGGVRTLIARSDVARYAALHGIALPEVDDSSVNAKISSDSPRVTDSAPAPLAKILLLPRREVPVAAEVGIYLQATADGREQANLRLATLEAWEAWRAAERGDDDAFVAHWRTEHPEARASRASIFRWRKAYLEGGVDALVPERATTPPEGPRIPRELLGRFLTYYGTKNRLSIAKAWELTRADALTMEIECPDYESFRRYVAEKMPPASKTLRRRGKVAMHNEHDPVMHRRYDNVLGNEWWDSDHHQFDLFCRDEHGKAVRPWVTVWEDIRTTAYMGWCLSFGPNSTTILVAFKRAIEKRGIPTNTLTDNGKDYKIHDFAGVLPFFRQGKLPVDETYARGLLGRLHVHPHFSIPLAPRGKCVERSFVEVKNGFSKMWPDAYCGGVHSERPEDFNWWLRHPEKLPSFLEVAEQWGQWVEGYYNRQQISRARAAGGPQLPRIDAWRAFTPVVNRIIDPANLALLCMRTSRPVTVMRGGIRMFDRDYDAPALDAYDRQRVLVRYDPENLGELFVFDEAERFVARAEAVAPAAWGGDEQQYREHAARKKRIRENERRYWENATAGVDAEAPTVTALIAAAGARESAEAVDRARERQAQVTRPFEMEEAWRQAGAAAAGGRRRAEANGQDDDLSALDGKYLRLFEERAGRASREQA